MSPEEQAQADFYAALTKWRECRDLKATMEAEHERRMAPVIEAELNARADLMRRAFPAPTYGTNNYEFGNGYGLKAVWKLTYKLTGTDAQVEAAEKLLPPAIAEALIKRKPSLSQGAYNKLEPAHKKIANEIVTITPAEVPTLELIEPKD